MIRHRIALVLLTSAGIASAQADVTQDEPQRKRATPAELAAEALFQDAKALIREGNRREACPKLAESHRLDPAGGTVLALALCEQAIDKPASAWLRYREALAFAKRDGREDRLRIAQTRIAELEPKLSRVTIRIPDQTRDLPGLEVTLDGVRLGSEALALPLPVDGGKHTLRASAPQHEPRSVSFSIAPYGATQAIDVGELVKRPAPAAPAAAPSKSVPVAVGPTPEPSGAPRWLTWTALGIGAAGSLTAAYFGLAAGKSRDEAAELCPNSPCSNPEGVDANERAHSQATAANVAAGVGLMGLGAFVVLLVTGSDSDSVAVRVEPSAISAQLRQVF